MPLSAEMEKLLEYYNTGLALYKERKFNEALDAFKKALEYKVDDGPCLLYIDRCEVLIKDPPPPEWDGVFTMTTK